MKLTKEQLTRIFTDTKLNCDINTYISQAHESIPSYVDGINVSIEPIQYYFEMFEKDILNDIEDTICVCLTNWNESKKYKDSYFEDFLKDLKEHYKNNSDMEWE